MIKDLPKKNTSGFSIIEIVISLFILIVLFSVTQAGYKEYILKRSLDTAKKDIISDIKLAQSYASSGKSYSTCSTVNGYSFSVNSSSSSGINNYEIWADCVSAGSTSFVKQINMLDKYKGKIYFQWDDSPVITFKVLGRGVIFANGAKSDVITIIQLTTGDTRTITVTSGGEIY
jgi:Tfp pilus assembly protein PilE